MEFITVEAPAAEYLSKQENQDIVTRIKNDFAYVNDFFNEKYEGFYRNFDFYAGNQWTQAEIDEHHRQFRKARVFNEIQHKVDHLIGTQNQTRLDVKCQARERGDEPAAELLTNIVKWTEQTNNFEFTETEIFTDGIVGGFGVARVNWCFEDMPYGYPEISRIPPDELCWDTDCKKPDLSSARWMARIVDMTRMDAVEEFPEYEDAIWRAAGGGTNELNWNRLKLRRNQWGPNKGREIISVVEYYERVKVYKFVVVDDIRGEENTFMESSDADDFMNGLIDEYTGAGRNIYNTDGSSLICKLNIKTDAIQQTIVIGTEAVFHQLTALDDFPYVVFFPYFKDGKFWSFVDVLVDPQTLINEFFSQWEYQLGAANKNVMTVMESFLKKGFGLNDVRRELSKSNSLIPVMNHGALASLPNQPINPELFQGIGFSIQRMTDYIGGRNAMGLQENAAESGKAVQARVEAGGLARLPLYDKLRQWRQNVSFRIVWYIKNVMTPAQILRIIGNDKDLQYVNLDDDVINSLREIKIDITIDEAQKSDSMKERYFQQWLEFFQTQPSIPMEMKMSMLIEFAPMPNSQKEEFKNQMEFYIAYQQQQNEASKQKKAEDEVKMSLYKRDIKDTMMAKENLTVAQEEAESQRRKLDRTLREAEKIRNDVQAQQEQIQKANLEQGPAAPANQINSL